MSPEAPPLAGTTLLNRYRLDAEIGRGGMGRVFRAQDLLLDRAVAVKLLSAAGLGTAGRSRLLQEARAAAQLNHPNIVAVYDAGEAEITGEPAAAFIVMELVAGRTLYEAWPLPPEHILPVARQICQALDHAHNHGIIHRDLKLENVLIMPAGPAAPPTVKLTDFGLARSVASRLTQDGGLTGTVYYLAPEIALGQPADGRADLYSLGVLLYELVTGQLPFTGDDPLVVISQHLHASLVPPHQLQPALDPALDALIVRLLAKTPAERPASAAEVGRRLEQIAHGAGPASTPRSALENVARGRLVGRAREADDLRAHWQRAARGEGRVLLITGEPGIGKTRLAQEVSAAAEISGGLVLSGECYAEGGAPYAPIAQMLGQMLAAERAAGLPVPAAVLADLGALAPELAALQPAGAPAVRSLEPQAEQSRLFESFVTVCLALAARTPLLLLLEDIHWADSGTLFLLRHVARRTRRARVLLVFTYRETDLDQSCCAPDVLADLNRERLSARLKLARFDLAGTRELLAVLFQGPVAETLAAAIHQETEGNPFFIEEVCKSLIEEGRLSQVDGRWHAAQLEQVSLPQSVRVTIQARVAKLPEPAQEALRLAAVMGREFDFPTLLQASAVHEDVLIAALEAAEQAQLIGETRRAGPAQFSFAHALIPSALREGVSGLRRQRLHRRIGAAIEALRPDDDEALAYHAEQAGDEERARAYTLRAGRRALAVYANREAERHFRAVVDALGEGGGGPLPDRMYALAGLGEALFRLGQYPPAIAAWQAAAALAAPLGELGLAARLYARMGRAAWQMEDRPRGLALCREGLAAVGQPAAPVTEGLAYLIHETGRACFFNELYPEARTLCERALELGRQLNVAEVQAEALATLGLLPDEAPDAHFRYLSEAVALAEAADLPATAIRSYINLGHVAREVGRPAAEVLGHFQHAREHARRLGHAAEEVHGLISASLILAQMGERAEFLSLLQEGRELLAQGPRLEGFLFYLLVAELLDTVQQGELETALRDSAALKERLRLAGQREWVEEVSAMRAQVCLRLGDLAQAEAELRECLALAARGPHAAPHHSLLAIVQVRQGNLPAAQAALAAARAAAGPWSTSPVQTALQPAAAFVAAAGGDWAAAFEMVEALLSALRAQGWRWALALFSAELADIYHQHGQPDSRQRGLALLREAAALYQAIGAPRPAAEAAERARRWETE